MIPLIQKECLRPVEYPDLVHLGRTDEDGGYAVPSKLIETAEVLLSLGLAIEWTFDLDVRKRNPNIRIIGVDHSIHPMQFVRGIMRGRFKGLYYRLTRNKIKSQKYRELYELCNTYFDLFNHPNRHLRKMVTDKDGPGTVSFDTLVEMAGGVRGHGIVLKMDIESSEYDVIPRIVAHEKSISVITGEFHELVSHAQRFNDAIAQLQKVFYIVHIHGNNYGAYSESNHFPDTVEITFVNRSLFDGMPAPSLHSYPRKGLDVANKPGKEDYELLF